MKLATTFNAFSSDVCGNCFYSSTKRSFVKGRRRTFMQWKICRAMKRIPKGILAMLRSMVSINTLVSSRNCRIFWIYKSLVAGSRQASVLETSFPCPRREEARPECNSSSSTIRLNNYHHYLFSQGGPTTAGSHSKSRP
jgi:hypothetical protein